MTSNYKRRSLNQIKETPLKKNETNFSECEFKNIEQKIFSNASSSSINNVSSKTENKNSTMKRTSRESTPIRNSTMKRTSKDSTPIRNSKMKRTSRDSTPIRNSTMKRTSRDTTPIRNNFSPKKLRSKSTNNSDQPKSDIKNVIEKKNTKLKTNPINEKSNKNRPILNKSLKTQTVNTKAYKIQKSKDKSIESKYFSKKPKTSQTKEEKIYSSPSKVISLTNKSTNNSSSRSKIKKEGKDKLIEVSSQKNKEKKSEMCKNDTIDSDDEFEEVDELTQLLKDEKGTEENIVKIEIKAEDSFWNLKKRKKKSHEELFDEHLRLEYNRNIRSIQENCHKVHLLTLFCHGLFVNKTLNSPTLMGCAVSVISNKNVYPPKRLNIDHLQRLVKWFNKKFSIVNSLKDKEAVNNPLELMLTKNLQNNVAYSNNELTLLFVLLTRALGINTRLVLNFNPITWKALQENLIKPKSDKDDKEDEEIDEPDTKVNVMPDTIIKKESSDKKKQSSKKNEIKQNKRKSIAISDHSETDDDDFQGTKKAKKKSKKESVEDKQKNKIKSSTSKSSTTTKQSDPYTSWPEVYVEEEEKWVCVCIQKETIHCIQSIRSSIIGSIAYATAFNTNLSVRDVTKRYVSNFLSSERRLRLDSEWWVDVLRPYIGSLSKKDKEEEKLLHQTLELQPLPKVVSEYKNHPLYALERHLLKFEAIYPKNADPVGFIKGEPVFPRENVALLRGKEYWIKEALVVKKGEEPYKIVKARPKWDRVRQEMIKDIPLELFGEWQVENYQPPVAVNGKVPRNQYGNVELFKPCMIPVGCVHIRDEGAGFGRLARKLGIDIAVAMIGFEFLKGGSRPVYDGYVICKDKHDLLMDAWHQEKINIAQREKEKREKRIYDNWRRIINGLLVKVHMKEMYGVKDQPKKIKKPSVKSNRKIKQKDIDVVKPSSSSTTESSEKVILEINTETTAVESIKAKLNEEKRFQNTLSESEEEIDAEEHEKKVEQIYKQSNCFAPDLSDESDNESNKLYKNDVPCNKLLDKNSKTMEKKLSSSGTKRRKVASTKSKKKFSPNPDDKSAQKGTRTRLRRSVGTTKYFENFDSESDVADDSDDDKNFDPIKEDQKKINKNSLDLSDDSDFC